MYWFTHAQKKPQSPPLSYNYIHPTSFYLVFSLLHGIQIGEHVTVLSVSPDSCERVGAVFPTPEPKRDTGTISNSEFNLKMPSQILGHSKFSMRAS